jgi:predicted RNase H-like HicB family nuclease
MQKFYYNKIEIIIENGEDGYFTAHCPSLKSCWSQGKTKREALENIKEAIDLYSNREQSKSKRFKVRKFNLGEKVHVDRDELYLERGN